MSDEHTYVERISFVGSEWMGLSLAKSKLGMEGAIWMGLGIGNILFLFIHLYTLRYQRSFVYKAFLFSQSKSCDWGIG